MNFSYNSNLEFDERVQVVADEICKEYPLISRQDAVFAAGNAVAVDGKVTNDVKFNRYYYIMKTIGRHHDEFPHVFNDAFKVYDQGLDNCLYIDVMPKIVDYLTGGRDAFPGFTEG